MKKLVIVLILMGLTSEVFAQQKTEVLDEIKLVGINYKYLNALGDEDVAIPVKKLEQKVATFDLKSLDVYVDDERGYNVYFKIPEGKIFAEYNNEGEIIRTAEKFKDIRLPLVVSNAIVEKYPGWKITGDIYLVSYRENAEIKKTYKLFIEKEGKFTRVKTDENGNFL